MWGRDCFLPNMIPVPYEETLPAEYDGAGNVLQRIDYYPFGSISAAWSSGTTPAQPTIRWRFSGKEIAGQRVGASAPAGTPAAAAGNPYLDFGARLYDPRTASWLSHDPLAEKYFSLSPFVYCFNCPIGLFDIDGLDPVPKVSFGRNYYKDRYNDFVSRNPGITPPSYYLSYGDKYLTRFLNETKKKLSKQGKKWINEVAINLQKAIEDRLSEPDGDSFEMKDEFKDYAFGSHSNAYINKGGKVPIEELQMTDLVQIALTPDFKDIFSIQAFPPVVEVVGHLLLYWISNPQTARMRYNELKASSSFIEMLLYKKLLKEMWGNDGYLSFMFIVDPSGIDE